MFSYAVHMFLKKKLSENHARQCKLVRTELFKLWEALWKTFNDNCFENLKKTTCARCVKCLPHGLNFRYLSLSSRCLCFKNRVFIKLFEKKSNTARRVSKDRERQEFLTKNNKILKYLWNELDLHLKLIYFKINNFRLLLLFLIFPASDTFAHIFILT